ncbi:MAG: hypothetical protein KA436_05405 [Oligoflexales bacterium]|nr:hypothetical protein [Oligoflexales bacterium]
MLVELSNILKSHPVPFEKMMNPTEKQTWTDIRKKLCDPSASKLVEKALFLHLQNQVLHLHVTISAQKVMLNQVSLDLSKRHKLWKIFSLFDSYGLKKLSRQDLIRAVFQVDIASISTRQQACYNHNIIKLLSRARQLAEKSFAGQSSFVVEWFPYQASSQTWRLYQIRDWVMTEN